MRGLCYYHLVIQGFERIVYPSLPKEGKEYEINNILIPKIKDYIKIFHAGQRFTAVKAL